MSGNSHTAASDLSSDSSWLSKWFPLRPTAKVLPRDCELAFRFHLFALLLATILPEACLGISRFDISKKGGQ